MSKKPSTIRIGRRYRFNRLEGPYDVLVVGSGIGGLTAAACLAKMGKKVCVLEQHYTAGGFTHSYDRNGYEWDVGVHYIGDVGSEHTMASRLFDYVTDGKLEWAPMDDHFDRVFLGDEHYDLVAGKPGYRDALVAAFPNEKRAIDIYLEKMKSAKSAIRALALRKILPGWLCALLPVTRVPEECKRTTREVAESVTSNQKLIAVLTSQWGDLGLPPAQSSFMMQATVAQHYMHGGYYPVGGASKMAETIIPVIQGAGGEVFTYASVEKILVGRRGAEGVLMADGKEIHAPVVISDAGVFNTFERLLDEAVPQRAGYLERLKNVRPSVASMCLYVGIRESAEALGLPRTNYWVYPSEHYEEDLEAFLADPERDLPLAYISFPSAKDPTFEQRYPGRATIEIVSFGPHEWFEPWAGTTWGQRGEDYEALKEKLSQRLLAKLFERMPQLEGKIDYYELSTSLSTDWFCRYSKGEIYGLDHDPRRFEQDWLRPRTDISGLYLAGQDVMSCGVVGAMVGGLLAVVETGGLRGWRLAAKLLA
jgi:phytoene dehydrogenase-like protein